MTEPAWTVDAPNAVSDVIDGELVVMNLASGHYFSGAGSGAMLWSGIERGSARSALVDALVAGFEVERAVASADLDRFVEVLVGHGLIRSCPPVTGATLPPPSPGAARQPYAPPTLEQYTDMKDLLLLDPIHDVAEEGWPMRPAESRLA